MTRDEALAIIDAEELDPYSWFEDPTNRTDLVGIDRDGEKWVVYTTNERAVMEGVRKYGSEGSTLDDFIKRLRGQKVYQEVARRRGW